MYKDSQNSEIINGHKETRLYQSQKELIVIK